MPVSAGGPPTYAVTLDDVKRHLNITSDANDAELLPVIGAAQQMVEHEVGVVTPTTVTDERHRYVRGPVYLTRTPVLSVTSLREYTGTTLTATLSGIDLELDEDAGAVYRVSTGGYGRFGTTSVLVTYVAGRNPTPDAISWAVMELTAHLWRGTQALRGGRGRGAAADTDTTVAALGYALPNRVADMLLPFKRTPAVY